MHQITVAPGITRVLLNPESTETFTPVVFRDEEGDYLESDETFSQVQLDAHKVGTVIKVSEELLQDSAFNLESYISAEFSRRIGDKEEEAFLVGEAARLAAI